MSSLYGAQFPGSSSTFLYRSTYTGNPAAFSISCWVYLSATQTDVKFFNNYYSPWDTGWHVGISNTTANKLKFFLGSNSVISSTTLSNNTWYHCVFTSDGSTANIYINGNTTPDASLSSALAYGNVTDNNIMGASLNGKLASMGFWTRALTAAEAASLYNSGSGKAFADLSGSLLTNLGSYHDFADSSNLGLDSSAAAQNFTNEGGVTRTTGPAVVDLDRTASADGNWSSTTTWGGLSVPVSGSNVTINSLVTLDQNASIKTLTINNTGKLTWATNKSLTCAGDVIAHGSGTNICMDMVAGSQLIFDTSSGTQYGLQIGADHFTYPRLRVRGISGNPATLKSVGSVNAYFKDQGFIGQGCIDAEYLNIQYFGDATHPVWIPWMGGSGSSYFRLFHCNLDNCGQISFSTGMYADATFILDNTKFSNSLNSIPMIISCATAMTGGSRSITYSAFDKVVNFFSPTDFTIQYCVFEQVWGSTASPWANFSHNFMRDVNPSSFAICGSVSDCYYLEDNSNTNPHGMDSTVDQNILINRLVIESVNGVGGDFLFPHNPASSRTYTVKNSIMLPKDETPFATPGKFVSMLGGANTNAIIEHCTYAVSDETESGIQTGETYVGRAGMVNSLRSNIAWRPTSGSGGYKFYSLSPSVQDTLYAINADYNVGWNLAAGSAGNGYNSTTSVVLFSTGTPGVHDINANPQFVDWHRNLAKWAVDNLGSASSTQAAKRSDAISALRNNPSLIDDLLTYIFAGFAPQNAALKNAGHDGVTIGASEVSIGVSYLSSGYGPKSIAF